MRRCAGVGALLAGALAASAPAGAQDSWEGRPLSAEQRAACRALPRALVRAVEPRYRRQAAALLQSAPFAALDEARAGAWIGVDAPPDGTLADRLLKDALEALQDRLTESFGEHAPKWNPTEQVTLEELRQATRGPHPALRPVLARAVADAAAGGTFDAAQCGDALAIRRRDRGAAGAGAPVAVIVFLERPPTGGVQAWREAAGR